MDLMFVKYSNGKRKSFVKDGSKILISNMSLYDNNTNNINSKNKNIDVKNYNKYDNCNSEIGKIPFKTNSVIINSNLIDFNSYALSKEKYVNEKITAYFFNSIHENYLRNK